MKNISTLISIFILSLFLLLFAQYESLSQNKDASEAEPSATNNYYFNTAKIYFEQKDYTKAVDTLELAILLEPNNEEAQTLLKQSRQLLEEINKSIGMPDKTGETKETKAAHPEDISQLIQNAYTAVKEGRCDDAAKIADLILTRDPANKEALYIKEKVNDVKHKHTTENLKAV
ncbi:MAG: xpsD, partial [Candidatus Brocadiaceae bacterium]|nr:xpsD [Candidatus Brocadiaceae bacterium]